MGIGKRIGTICAQHGMSIRQLAIKAGVPYTTMYSAIKRDSDSMDFETLKKIANALGVEIEWLLSDSDSIVETFRKKIKSMTKREKDEHFDELLKLEAIVSEESATISTQKEKTNLFANAAFVAGYAIVGTGPYSVVDVFSGHCIASNVSKAELAKAEERFFDFAGLVCIQMSDTYRTHSYAMKGFDPVKGSSLDRLDDTAFSGSCNGTSEALNNSYGDPDK